MINCVYPLFGNGSMQLIMKLDAAEAKRLLRG
jgi:hypothetical protein